MRSSGPYSPPGWSKPIGVYGICSVCLEPVPERDKFSHPCRHYHVSYGWTSFVNPRNEPWIPGYRFRVQQPAQNTSRTWRMKPREYGVIFMIDENGLIIQIGGPRATPATQEIAEEAYSRGRPGSNYY